MLEFAMPWRDPVLLREALQPREPLARNGRSHFVHHWTQGEAATRLLREPRVDLTEALTPGPSCDTSVRICFGVISMSFEDDRKRFKHSAESIGRNPAYRRWCRSRSLALAAD
jgi:hypothetical protein